MLAALQNKDGIDTPLLLCLDVKTHWSSTSFMMKRYLKLRQYFDLATLQLYKLRVVFKKQRPCTPLTSAEVHTLNQCVTDLPLGEAGTAQMGSSETPTTHIKDVILARVFQKCTQVEATLPLQDSWL